MELAFVKNGSGDDTYVVNVLATNRGCDALAACGSLDAPLVPELSLLLDQVPLGRVVVTVVKLAVLDGTELSCVLLGKDLAVLDRLDSAVVVVLVNLLVYRSVDLLMHVGLNGLMGDSGGNSLVDCSVVVTRLAGEVGKSRLDLVHFDVCKGALMEVMVV
jgi:hypothetical protein